jgi:ABC-2 type transport system ATP-binding protein
MTQAVILENLRKTYANGTEALSGIDLSVNSGDFFALLGPNGAGKSTAIGILSSLINKTAGNVSVLGHDQDQETELAKSYIGLVPQEFNFNQFEPVAEIVINQAGYYGIPRRQAYAKAKIFLQKLDLWGKRDAQARELSGGMKRRLMIARALVHQPRLLILDEPTAGVDIEIRRSMWDFLKEINTDGTTIILTTHYLEEAESLCRNIAIINHGNIVEHTAMDQLLRGLHTDTFVLTTGQPVAPLDESGIFSLRWLDEHTLEADVRKGQCINDLFQDLSARRIDVTSMRNKQNRLEQLFMDKIRQSSGYKEPGT